LTWFNIIRGKYANFKVIGSTAKSNKFIMNVDLTNPMALLIGNETYGLSDNYKGICDDLVKIPMYGKITSFNVACAATLMFYEATRQRNL
jgi:TrmH family RNA methyltransferase